MNENEKLEMRREYLRQKNTHLKKDACRKAYENAGVEYEVAKALYFARKKAKITQKEIAEFLGTKQSAVSRIEKGCNISIETIAKYADACGKKVKLQLVDA